MALEALAAALVQRLVEAAEIADAVSGRVLEVVEVGVVRAGLDLAEFDRSSPVVRQRSLSSCRREKGLR